MPLGVGLGPKVDDRRIMETGATRNICEQDRKLWIENALDEDLHACRGTISAHVDGDIDAKILFTLSNLEGAKVFEAESTPDSSGLAQVPFVLQQPALWYRHGYEAQIRYNLEAALVVDSVVLHRIQQKIGFRRAELIQEKDANGKSFYFRINDIDIFAGVKYLPTDTGSG